MSLVYHGSILLDSALGKNTTSRSSQAAPFVICRYSLCRLLSIL